MRPIAINQRALRAAKEELDSAREDLRSALGDIDHPGDDFPWRDLVVEGVRSLVADAEQVAKGCHTLAAAVDDSIVDFDDRRLELCGLQNAMLTRGYEALAEALGARAAITLDPSRDLADARHHWKLEPFHYARSYNASATARLIELVDG